MIRSATVRNDDEETRGKKTQYVENVKYISNSLDQRAIFISDLTLT
jgi:hypothetical protein